MGKELLSTKTLEAILQRTRGALEDGRSQMFEVADAARQECSRTEVIFNAVQLEMQQAILDVEELTLRFSRSRLELYKSNKDFQEYSEQEKKMIYEEAAQIRGALTAARERERLLRVRRDSLEQTLVKLREIAEKAERLVSQVGVALNCLSGSLSDVNQQIENFQARENAGQELVRGQELERRRMANALHDGPVQDLANLMVQLEICERLYLGGKHADAAEQLEQLKSIAQGSLADLRHIIYDLNPMTLDDLGLSVTIKNGLSNLASLTGIKTQFVLLGTEERLDSQVEMAIFRIVQEALNNCRKHANATSVKVTLEFSRQSISAEVKDDGVGFELFRIQEKLRSGKHYGMLSMQSRASVLGGSVHMHSNPGQGTRILAKIPFFVSGEDTVIE